MSHRNDPDYRDPGTRDSYRDSASRESSREPGRGRDGAGRHEDRYGQPQRRDNDTSWDSDYRSARYGAEDRYEERSPMGRYGRRDPNERDYYPNHSAAPYYGAGYSGTSTLNDLDRQDSGRWAERSGQRSPQVRGLYQEQAWSRDPRTGELSSYEYETRWPTGATGGDSYQRPLHAQDQTGLSNLDWRSDKRSRGGQDSSRNFGHAGKGPKGYVRSDERIREDVCDRLSVDDEVDASDITVNVSGGEVRLEGTVLDRHSKHRAEDLAEAVSGVRDVNNNLRTRKGFFQEVGDKLSGDDKSEHRGHAGSGTHNVPSPNAPNQNSTLQNQGKGGLSANR